MTHIHLDQLNRTEAFFFAESKHELFNLLGIARMETLAVGKWCSKWVNEKLLSSHITIGIPKKETYATAKII